MLYLNFVFLNEDIYTIIMGKSNVGIFWETGEVLKCNMSIQVLSENINIAISKGNIPVPQPVWEDLGRVSVTEKAVGIRGWRKMTRLGAIMCLVYVYEDKLLVSWSDPVDIQKFDLERVETFAPDYPIESLAEHLIAVARQRQAAFGKSSSVPNVGDE
jgi:hypothetical protein